jgi:hypothetical protein
MTVTTAKPLQNLANVATYRDSELHFIAGNGRLIRDLTYCLERAFLNREAVLLNEVFFPTLNEKLEVVTGEVHLRGTKVTMVGFSNMGFNGIQARVQDAAGRRQWVEIGKLGVRF